LAIKLASSAKLGFCKGKNHGNKITGVKGRM
jgi:hypothetical protein